MPDTTKADYAVLRWLVAATFIVILNETIMMNAIYTLMGEFHVSERAAQWLSTAFMLTMAVVIPITGWFLQRFTTRQAFAVAMIVFCAGTLLAGLAPAFWVLLAGRIVQAAGTAVMFPLLMTTLMSVVPEHDRGRVMGNVTLAMSVAPAMGPAVSGVILDSLGWRWMFLLVLPIAAAIGAVGLSRLTNVGERVDGTVDAPSVVLAALGFGSLVYGLSLIGAEHQPVEPGLLIPGSLSVIGLFVWRQLSLQKVDAPLLDLRTLKHPTYAKSLVLLSLAFLAMLGSMILLPLYLTGVRDLSVMETGLLLMPGGLAMGLLGPQVGKVFDRFGGRVLVIPGSIGIVASLALFTRLDATTSVAFVLGAHVLFMVSLAALFTPVFTLGLGAVPPQLYSHASSLLGTIQQVAGAIGAALSITVLTSRATDLAAGGASKVDAAVGGYQAAFLVSAVLALAVVALALVLPGRPENDPHAGAGDEAVVDGDIAVVPA